MSPSLGEEEGEEEKALVSYDDMLDEMANLSPGGRGRAQGQGQDLSELEVTRLPGLWSLIACLIACGLNRGRGLDRDRGRSTIEVEASIEAIYF